MDRREFIGILGNNPISETEPIDKRPAIQSGLEPLSGTLDRSKAMHLLRRLGFGPSEFLLSKIVGQTANNAVTILFDKFSDKESISPGNWINIPLADPLTAASDDIRYQIEAVLNTRYNQLIDWWLKMMVTEDKSVREKLTLFLHSIWCVAYNYDTVALIPPALLYRNNQTLRADRLGSYNQIVKDMTLDGAMLLYQSLNYSSKPAPNENFSRELMELDTLGIGNYSQQDVRESAKILSGWRIAAFDQQLHPNGYLENYFSPSDHDTSEKTFMGVTFSKDIKTENEAKTLEVYKLVDTLFNNQGTAIASFIAEKAFKFFVYSSPNGTDDNIISQLADKFLNGDPNAKPNPIAKFDMQFLLRTLLSSAYFYDPVNIGIQVKTPVDFIIGLQRNLGINYPAAQTAMADLEQVLYNPQNTGGWLKYHSWINSKTYPLRILHAKAMLNQVDDIGLIALLSKCTKQTVLVEAISYLAEMFLPKQIEQSRLDSYKTLMLSAGGFSESGWSGEISSFSSAASRAIKALLMAIICEPDYQLC